MHARANAPEKIGRKVTQKKSNTQVFGEKNKIFVNFAPQKRLSGEILKLF